MVEIWMFVLFTLLGLLFILTLVVFCFWFLYLLQIVVHKRNIYKKALDCLEASSDYTQQTTARDAETELIKNIYLFFINLAEGVAVIIISVAFIWSNTEMKPQSSSRINNTEYSPQEFFVFRFQPSNLILKSFQSFARNLVVLSFVLVSSLCKYLAGRYTQITWIKSNNIPRTIGLFLIYLVVSQFLTLVDSFEIDVLVRWLNTLLFTSSLIFALKGYRKLCMVINWTIVDLKVRRNKPKLVRRHIRMKRRSTRIFTVTMIGAFTLLFGGYLQDTPITLKLIIQHCISVSSLESLLQGNPHATTVISDIKNIITVAYSVGICISVLGIVIMSVPYTGCGLVTMYTVAWRLYKGKSGYRTHFPNQLLRAGSPYRI